MSEFAQNVGRLDAAARFVAGVGVLAGGFWLSQQFNTDWALTLILHPAILGVYLFLTAAARNDIAYHMFGFSTIRRARERHHMRLTPPSPGGRRPIS